MLKKNDIYFFSFFQGDPLFGISRLQIKINEKLFPKGIIKIAARFR